MEISRRDLADCDRYLAHFCLKPASRHGDRVRSRRQQVETVAAFLVRLRVLGVTLAIIFKIYLGVWDDRVTWVRYCSHNVAGCLGLRF